MPTIHPTAIIDPTAELHETVSVGPYSIIAGNVTIDSGTQIGSHVFIDQYTRIGKDCQLFPFTSIGTAPQDKKFKGEKTELVIGDENVIREYATINRGTPDGGVSPASEIRTCFWPTFISPMIVIWVTGSPWSMSPL